MASSQPMSWEERTKKVADALLLPSNIVRNVDLNGDGQYDGFQFDMGNPWHTAIPIDNIKNLSISVDGEKIDPEKVYLLIRSNRIKLTNVATIPEIYLGFGELFSVFVEKPGGLPFGNHEMEVSLTLYPSFYLFMRVTTYTTKKSVVVVPQ